jgi:tetratricopeptide (TPR) repeat protein/predicted Ser/Thr protein kinase
VLVSAPLASGGAATVHAVDDEPHVIKIAHEGAFAAACLRHEADVLARLSSPWSPAMVARTTIDGRAALVLERIDGTPLSTWRLTATVRERMTVATRLLERIAGIHARRVVHGDLSGHNVLVTPGGDVRIIDFGAARSLDDDRAPMGPRVATLAYLAPAHAEERATCAADVYAAGVLLFELITGRLPFEHAAGALRQAHALRRPPPPSSLVPVSLEVERVIIRCLAKQAARRFRDGVALRDAWRAALAGARPVRLVPRSVAAEVTPDGAARPSIAPTAPLAVTPRSDVFVGRERELQRLLDIVADARRERRGALVTIEGDAGVGKSRLLAAVVGALDASSSEGGDVVIIDDASSSEPAVLRDAVLALRRSDTHARVVIAAGRPGAFDHPTVRDAARRIAMILRPLDAVAAAALLRALLPDVVAVPAALVERLAARTDGVPLVIHELVHLLRAEGRVHDGRLDAELEHAGTGIRLIEWLVERDVARLGPDLAGHAFLAALLGRAADADAVVRVAAALDRAGAGAFAPLDPRAAIDRLVAAGVLRRREGRLETRHPLVREALMRRTPPAQRVWLATAACDALAGQVDDDLLAMWAEAAGRVEVAIAAWSRVAVAAAACHDHLANEHACSRALALLGDDDARGGDVYARRARARYRLGKHVAAAEDFARASRMVKDPERQATLLLDEAMALDWARDFAAAARATQSAARLVAPTSPRTLVAALALAMGRTSWRAGDARAARRDLEHALALSISATSDEGEEIAIVAGIVLGFVHAELDDLADAQTALASAGTRANARGDRVHEAAALNNLAFVSWRRGSVEALPAIHARVVTLGRELGMPTHEYRAQRWMFEASLLEGAVDAARAQAARVVELERCFPELFPAPAGILALARLAAHAGDMTAATQHLAACPADALTAADAAVANAIGLASAQELAPSTWRSLALAARDAGDADAAVEICRLGRQAGADVAPLIDELLATTSLAPAVRRSVNP